MTSKLTREERVQALYDLKVGQVLSLADIENVKMLSRMALAAMDSEPVADDGIFRPGDAVGVFNVGCETCPDHLVAWTVKGQNLPVGNYWLYISPQPAPVVPDGYVMVPVEPNGDMLAAAQDAYCETDGDIASTLRAAMLAAAPQEVK
ncbi:hypothetical protein RJQ11_01985 [Klebsiella pneumoniae]|uniref:hypothetical protein n=1 Tax=Klebsiella pneumoniae TaxID=573 RepID=UPI0004ED913F|nr:hypothetical protein [Klebsiella pneumoniae]AIK83669.1 hypothetical protein VK055_5148 [Klebsiella pneumoniae subsp. pneumoniae]MDC7854622.1 hypothetical protein [Klebsiella pneumoniae]MDW5538567.1 hypothetical protein [Klebsiella pneumoniae]ODO64205.1 hypothetical protein BAY44_13945 [Klebsiella pneumoniae]QPW34738.1 hypothetical protein IT767_02875 [Klebsiella pneumoniae subsp. pneumoniae ATCC 43816]